jgi:hypothetical protein
MIAMTMRENDRPEIVDLQPEDIEVVQRGQTAEASVVEDRLSGTVTLDGQQERVAVLGEQLLPLRVER